jgi:CO dehydrogenase maturation factor
MVCGKGGSGKSVISVLMARALAKRYRVFLIDSDESNVLLPRVSPRQSLLINFQRF